MNWYLIDRALGEDRSNLRYIIAAFQQEAPGDKSIEEIKAGILRVDQDNLKIKEDNLEVKTMVSEILREVNSISNSSKKK